DVNGTTAESTYTPTIDPVTPVANPDKTSGPQGVPQSIDPLANDEAGDPAVPLDPDSLTLLDAEGNPADSVTVPGEGTYTIEDGKIVFTPEPQFTGTATPVDYRIADVNGTTARSTYTPTIDPVTPTASPDKTSGPKGKPQSIDPLANDKAGDPAVPLDPSSLTLLDKDGNPVDTVTVPGEGVYTIEDGKIVFTPEPDFTGTATPVRYRVADVNGTTTESTYTPTVLPDAPVPGEPGPGEPSKPGKPGKSAKPGTPGTPGTTAKNGDLPATGSEVSPALLGLGVAALVGGLLFTWVGRRRNRA
ncbi:LPXTG cell wall anchor domain-containing protein, partial [Pimelobacter simplex]